MIHFDTSIKLKLMNYETSKYYKRGHGILYPAKNNNLNSFEESQLEKKWFCILNSVPGILVLRTPHYLCKFQMAYNRLIDTW